MGASSPAGYIYPSLWLQNRFGKGISDLANAVQADSYASAFARLASGQVDALMTYADARRDYAERWNTVYGREGSIWEETKDRLKKSALALSGGQQQRLCIARTLAVEPEVLLMDEPTSALDPISTSKIEDLMTELKKNYTVVIVTHNMQQAARVSDRTAFFLLGELVEYGETEQIFSVPKDKRCEDYITGRFG